MADYDGGMIPQLEPGWDIEDLAGHKLVYDLLADRDGYHFDNTAPAVALARRGPSSTPPWRERST